MFEYVFKNKETFLDLINFPHHLRYKGKIIKVIQNSFKYHIM